MRSRICCDAHPAFDKHADSREHQKVVRATKNKTDGVGTRDPVVHSANEKKLNEEQRQVQINVFLLSFHKRTMDVLCIHKRLGANVRNAYHSGEDGSRIIQCLAKTTLSFGVCSSMDQKI